MAIRTFTHLYDDYAEAEQTVQALEAAGVPHSDISIVGNNVDDRHASTGRTATTGTTAGTVAHDAIAHDGEPNRAATGATTGTLVGTGVGLLTGLGLLAIPGVGPVVAAGWLVATVTGAGIGAAGGGLLGSLVHAGVPEEHAHAYAEGVRRGGTLVSVRGDDSQAVTIEEILAGRQVRAVDLDTRRADFRTGGWDRFDETSPHYTAEQLDAERRRRV
ncbi:general stress protein [Lichenicoccus roseus]|uniref:general stress protein n=1 Tax=Lichenicoccus roseus TaxID=2683649 RepID=UPI001980ABF6|nr:general stress protein [Lichenicoccus roseus]